MLLRLDLHDGRGDGHRAPGGAGADALPAVQSALCGAITFYLTIGMFEALWSVLLRDLGAETWLIGLTLSIFTIPMIVFDPRAVPWPSARAPSGW